jgi:hypothetical protein
MITLVKNSAIMLPGPVPCSHQRLIASRVELGLILSQPVVRWRTYRTLPTLMGHLA